MARENVLGVAQQKAALRKRAKAALAQWSDEDLAASNRAIAAGLRAMPQFQAAQTLFIFISIGREVGTHGLIEERLQAAKRVCVPRCEKGGIMQARHIVALSEAQPAPFGLLEPPATAPIVSPQAIDLVVAPCLMADTRGHRLGYGGGYYDRFLAALPTTCPVVCLCRSAFLVNTLPTDGTDIPADFILTENGLMESGAR